MSSELIPVQIVHDFAKRIEPLGLDYMLTGSLAMMQYGVYRMTADIDIVIELKPEDAKSNNLGFRTRLLRAAWPRS
jgi:hypothetical protein